MRLWRDPYPGTGPPGGGRVGFALRVLAKGGVPRGSPRARALCPPAGVRAACRRAWGPGNGAAAPDPAGYFGGGLGPPVPGPGFVRGLLSVRPPGAPLRPNLGLPRRLPQHGRVGGDALQRRRRRQALSLKCHPVGGARTGVRGETRMPVRAFTPGGDGARLWGCCPSSRPVFGGRLPPPCHIDLGPAVSRVFPGQVVLSDSSLNHYGA